MLMEHYFNEIERLVASVRTEQKDAIVEAAAAISKSIAQDGILHVFGSGHSHMIAEDLFHRAGGLVCVNAMLEASLMELNVGRATQLERLSGYAEVLLQGYDLRAGEVIIIVSNSGINPVPIEMAMACKEKGLYVIALTNMAHSTKEASRHHSGKKLFELADLVLDNGGVHGDAVLAYSDGSRKVGATSTIGGIIVVQALMVEVVEALLHLNMEPPVLVSANSANGDAHNQVLLSRYRDRIRYLL